MTAQALKHGLPIRLLGAWAKMERDYRFALAEMNLATFNGGASEQLHDTYTKAVDLILLTPAETLPDIRLKIDVMREQEIEDGWWCAKEAIALLAIDAARLIDPTREGGAA